MIGAGTIRAEKLRLDVPGDLARVRAARGLNPQPLAIVVTARGDVPLEDLLGASPGCPVILAPEGIPGNLLAELSSSAWVELIPGDAASGTSLDLRDGLKVLRKRHGVQTLLVEGGPSLNHSLIRNGLADELFLTLAPKLLGGEGPGYLGVIKGPPLRERGILKLELLSVHVSMGEIFLRYAL
jgi:riboflavin biosynthesis pyrimidine reductase